MDGGIWVVGEIRGEKIEPVTLELLTRARDLCKRISSPLTAVLIGVDVEDHAGECMRFGAKKVIVVQDKVFSPFSETIYGRVFADLAKRWRPDIILSGATERAKAFMPISATLLETGLTANCMGLDVEPDTRTLLQTRPAYGGNLMATIVCRKAHPQMATVRPGVFKARPVEGDVGGEVEAIELPDSILDNPFILEGFEEKAEAQGVPDYKNAKVVITAGRGVAEPGWIQSLQELAELMGGVLGATRPVVDMELLPRYAQIGQTGQIVSPRLYVGFGVSGAAPHTMGIQGAKIIVAINKDASAPIFNLATYGIQGDAKEIIPILVDRIKQEKGIN